MRLVLELVPLLLLLVGSLLLVAAVRRPRGAPLRGRARLQAVTRARWEAAHYADAQGRTHVVVQRSLPRPDGGREVLDRREVAVLDDTDPDWIAALSGAMTEARVRAAVLEAGA